MAPNDHLEYFVFISLLSLDINVEYKKYKMLLLLILRISVIDAVPITKQSGGQYLYNYGYLLSNDSSKGKNCVITRNALLYWPM